MAETKVTTSVQHNQDEFALIEWLKKETSRTRSGAYKFAAKKLAEELGYKPLKPKKKG